MDRLSFHPLIENAYQQTIRDMAKIFGSSFIKITRNDLNKNYKFGHEFNTSDYSCAHFRIYGPAHYLKCLYTFQVCSDDEVFRSMFRLPIPYILLDVGCGGGAASGALLNHLINLVDSGYAQIPKEVYLVGIDPDETSVRIFRQFINNISAPMFNEYGTIVNAISIPAGIPDGLVEIMAVLKQVKDKIGTPILPHLCVCQSNILKPLGDLHKARQKLYFEIVESSETEFELYKREFGEDPASTYIQITSGIEVDYWSLITIGVEGQEHVMDNITETMRGAFADESSDYSDNIRFLIDRVTYKFPYSNPKGSYFQNHLPNKPISFLADAMIVKQMHEQWQQMVSIENLRLAWSRSYRYLLREAFCDEIALNQFNLELEVNLRQLSDGLQAYVNELARAEARLPYPFPKKEDKVRPRVLTSFEEDILAVAVVQVLARTAVDDIPNSFEYQIENRDISSGNEFLYKYYFDGYKEFKDVTRRSAERLSHRGTSSVIVSLDVRSYYTRIIQSKLVSKDITHIDSGPLEWILRKMLTNPMPSIPTLLETLHDEDRGIVQGSTASGYFAKIYLKPLHDTILQSKKGIQLYRYADDMVMVVPDSRDQEAAIAELNNRLQKLGLELNPDKVMTYSPHEWLLLPQNNERADFDEYNDRIRSLITGSLFFFPVSYYDFITSISEDNDLWWEFVNLLRIAFLEIGIYMSMSWISRKINEQSNPLDKIGTTLVFPSVELLYDNPQKWGQQLLLANAGFSRGIQELREDLNQSFSDAVELFLKAPPDTEEDLSQLTTLRFLSGRLCRLGFFDSTKQQVLKLLEDPTIFKWPNWLIECLAIQGVDRELINLLTFYESSTERAVSYIRAVIIKAIKHFNREFLEANVHQIQEILYRYVANATNIEQMAASEVLLFQYSILGNRFEKLWQCIESPYVEDFRVIRNLLYTLSLCNQIDIEDLVTYAEARWGDNESLNSVFRIIELDKVKELVVVRENAVLRTTYYSERYDNFAADLWTSVSTR